MSPRLFYDNRFNDTVLTPSSTATGNYYVGNLADWRPYTFWKPVTLPATVIVYSGSSSTANYWGLFAHNLFTCGCFAELRGSTDSFISSNVLIDTYVPTSDADFVRTMTSTSYPYWQIRIARNVVYPTIKGPMVVGPSRYQDARSYLLAGNSHRYFNALPQVLESPQSITFATQLTSGAVPSIGIAAAGNSLTLDGFLSLDYDPVGRSLICQSNANENGRMLGKVIEYTQMRQTITMRRCTWAWLRATWVPAWNSRLRAYPFALQWNAAIDSTPLLVGCGDNFSTPHYQAGQADLQFEVYGVY